MGKVQSVVGWKETMDAVKGAGQAMGMVLSNQSSSSAVKSLELLPKHTLRERGKPSAKMVGSNSASRRTGI
jgi:hypothetical protein